MADHHQAANRRKSDGVRNLLARAHGLAQAQRFAVDIVRPDGSAEHLVREGGSSIDAANDAMERAGLGGVVRVRPMDCGAAA